MYNFLVKLPTVDTQADGFVNNSSGNFVFPLELRVSIDENGQKHASQVDVDYALSNNESNKTTESMKME